MSAPSTPCASASPATPLARERGYTAGTFSFNAGGNGRCPTCGGNGFEHVEMQFLSDVYLRCPDCDGRRYRAEVLEVTRDQTGPAMSIADVLGPDGDAGLDFFADQTGARARAGAPDGGRASATCVWASRCRPCPAARPSA